MAKKASPTPSVRESIDTPVTGTPRSPTTSAPWVARTISWTVKVGMLGRPLAEDGARHVTVVEGQHVGADDLVGLVPLARDDHGVAGAGPGERVRDGRATVGLGGPARVAARHGPHPGQDLVDDGAGRLRARVVRGDPHPIGQPRRDPAHDRALAAVAVAAAAEDHP